MTLRDLVAAMAFFGVTLTQAWHLFDPDEYVGGGTIPDVVARIRELVASAGAGS